MHEDTICAPATPPINSTLAIIRISGPESFRAVELLFSNYKNLKPRSAMFGSIIHNNKIIDDVILIYYPSPNSFSGEDMVELFCHGNRLIVHRIISALNQMGIRMAEPGEFSKRSFLNGKIDLTEAEAINHVITAKSEWEIDTAIRQMHGALKDIINTVKNDTILLKADIEAGIDFIEEEIEFVTYEQAGIQAGKISSLIYSLITRCKTGEKLSRGIDVTICGKPNVGKSSILNLILNRERAIVSAIPGTTRDTISESVQINGIEINLTDTAGIHAPDNEIEKIGIELSHKTIEKASIVIMVIDGSAEITDEDRNIISELHGKQKIFLINKSDISNARTIKKIQDHTDPPSILFSAKTGEGLEKLRDAISKILANEFVEYKDSFVADMRIIDLLEKSAENISRAAELINYNEPVEIIAFEMQALIDNLSGITGEITPDDILGSIFSRFCIGK